MLQILKTCFSNTYLQIICQILVKVWRKSDIVEWERQLHGHLIKNIYIMIIYYIIHTIEELLMK